MNVHRVIENTKRKYKGEWEAEILLLPFLNSNKPEDQEGRQRFARMMEAYLQALRNRALGKPDIFGEPPRKGYANKGPTGTEADLNEWCKPFDVLREFATNWKSPLRFDDQKVRFEWGIPERKGQQGPRTIGPDDYIETESGTRIVKERDWSWSYERTAIQVAVNLSERDWLKNVQKCICGKWFYRRKKNQVSCSNKCRVHLNNKRRVQRSEAQKKKDAEKNNKRVYKHYWRTEWEDAKNKFKIALSAKDKKWATRRMAECEQKVDKKGMDLFQPGVA